MPTRLIVLTRGRDRAGHEKILIPVTCRDPYRRAISLFFGISYAENALYDDTE